MTIRLDAPSRAHVRRDYILVASAGRSNYERHGMTDTPTHKIWRGLFTRCENPNHRTYKYYGARGIRVCQRWRSFSNFYADMGERPPGLTLDRIDADGDYSPGNCRWATPQTQNANRRSSRLFTHGGETLCIADWAKRARIPYTAMHNRLAVLGWAVERAITTPSKPAIKTQCPQGHVYTETGLYVGIRKRSGKKVLVCKACALARSRAQPRKGRRS